MVVWGLQDLHIVSLVLQNVWLVYFLRPAVFEIQLKTSIRENTGPIFPKNQALGQESRQNIRSAMHTTTHSWIEGESWLSKGKC